MRRRDIILLAVLINSGLLALLFATADHEIPIGQIPPSPKPISLAVADPTPPAIVEEAIEESVFPDGIAPIAAAAASLEPVTTITEDPEPIVSVTVKRGDSLDKIARANGTTIAALMALNGLTDTRLQIGSVLQVPVSEADARVDATPAIASVGEYYTIESGDSPWSVSLKFRIPLDELLTLNDLDEESARKLRPGDQVRIR